MEEITRAIRRYSNQSAFLLTLICFGLIWVTLPLSLLSESTDPLSAEVQEKIWQEIYNQDFHSSKKLVQLELSKSGKN
ncbi:hypothetical protein EHQ90_07850, partial [Leptospira stimsonii]